MIELVQENRATVKPDGHDVQAVEFFLGKYVKDNKPFSLFGKVVLNKVISFL